MEAVCVAFCTSQKVSSAFNVDTASSFPSGRDAIANTVTRKRNGNGNKGNIHTKQG